MRTILILVIIGVVSAIFVLSSNQARTATRIVFCDVGQGDAIYLRLDSQIDVLIDSGPYSQIISCLNQEMPYFDRTIELAFLTHPEKDHFGGFPYLLGSFKIQALYLPTSVRNNLPSNEPWQQFWQQAKNNINEINYLSQGDEISIGTSLFTILWPEATSTESKIQEYNNSALGILAQVKDKQILLLSDMDIAPAERAISQLNLNVDIFKINQSSLAVIGPFKNKNKFKNLLK